MMLDALKHFFGAHFHQDWGDEYESEDVAVEDYVVHHPVADLVAVVKSLRAPIACCDGDAELTWRSRVASTSRRRSGWIARRNT